MAFPYAAVAGAGASLIGSGLSFLGGQSANQMSADNAAANRQFQQELTNYQLANANTMAQYGITWRVQDAKRAGISPLVALGAPTFTPPSVGLGGSDASFSNPARGFEGMGQDLSRAAMAAQSDKARMDMMMTVENMRNNSALTRSEVEKNMADAALARRRAELVSTPGFPSVPGERFISGQGNTPEMTVTKPSTTISPSADASGVEAAVTPAVKPVRMTDGGIDPQPSLGTSVGATGETLGYILRNRLNPPAGYHVGWNGAWYPDKGSTWWDRPLGYSRLSKESSGWMHEHPNPAGAFQGAF